MKKKRFGLASHTGRKHQDSGWTDIATPVMKKHSGK
jgi:hypothetical protein